jgi:hypothetical protein
VGPWPNQGGPDHGHAHADDLYLDLARMEYPRPPGWSHESHPGAAQIRAGEHPGQHGTQDPAHPVQADTSRLSSAPSRRLRPCTPHKPATPLSRPMMRAPPTPTKPAAG